MQKYSSFYRVFNEAPPPASPPPPPPPASPPAPPAATFTQEQVNAMMAEHKKGLKADREQLAVELENLKKTANLTAEEKQTLQDRIDNLTKDHQTKEQQLASEIEKTKKKYDNELKTALEKAATSEAKFHSIMIDHALTTAAVKHKAFSPDQIKLMFEKKAKVVEVLDDSGKPTGNYTVKMPVKTVDEKTKAVLELEMNVEEALGKLREDDAFANMFVDPSTGGTGGTGSSGRSRSNADGAPPLHDVAAYRKFRKENNLRT